MLKFIACHTLIWPLYALASPVLIPRVRYSAIALFNSPKFPDQLHVNNQSAPESGVVLLPGIYLSSHKLFSILHRLTAIPLRLRIQDLGTPWMLIWPDSQGERQSQNGPGFSRVAVRGRSFVMFPYCLSTFCCARRSVHYFFSPVCHALSLLLPSTCNSLLGRTSDYCTVEGSFVVRPT